MGEYLQIIIIGIIAIIIFKLGFKGTLKAIISFALNLIVGLVLLYVINKYAILGLYIPVNLFTSIFVGIFGALGVLVLAIVYFLGIF